MLIWFNKIYSKQNRILGFSLIEVIVFTGLIALITGIIILLFLKLFNLSQSDKAYQGALVLAKNKIEYIRNLPYEDIGILGGVPSGDLLSDEEVFFNSVNYNIHTDIFYVDDPYDGTLETGDLVPTDYKRVRVKVSWENPPDGKPVYLSTDIAPYGLETDVAGGIIDITVLDADAKPVQSADVSITNSNVTPEIDINTQTDSSGKVKIVGAPESIESYHIVVTKTGYSKDQTYQKTEQNVNPKPPDLSVFDKKVSAITFSIDLLSNINIQLLDYQTSNPLPDTTITIFGSKIIGEDSQGEPILKFSKEVISDNNGFISLNDLEFDNYDFLPNSSYDIAEAFPIPPFYLPPNSSKDVIIKLYPHTDYHLWVIVIDQNENPLPQAEVLLENSEIPYSETKFTSEYGQVFFPDLQPNEYDITISLEGYEQYQDKIDVSNVSKAKIILNPL